MRISEYGKTWDYPPEDPAIARSPEIACSVCGQARPQVRNLPYCKECYYEVRYYGDDFGVSEICEADRHE